MTATIIPERLARLADMPLKSGKHKTIADGMCVMEAAAWVAGESHSDRPACVCPVIGDFMRRWNDEISVDADREKLKPLVPAMIGTIRDHATANRRAFMCLDWAVREFTPEWLAYCDTRYSPYVDALRALPEITSLQRLIEAMPELVDARNDAIVVRKTAPDAGFRSHLREKVWQECWLVAKSAGWGAAFSPNPKPKPMDAQCYVARSAALDAMWIAAWAVPDIQLDPIKDKLQSSAVDLVLRLCAISGRPQP